MLFRLFAGCCGFGGEKDSEVPPKPADEPVYPPGAGLLYRLNSTPTDRDTLKTKSLDNVVEIAQAAREGGVKLKRPDDKVIYLESVVKDYSVRVSVARDDEVRRLKRERDQALAGKKQAERKCKALEADLRSSQKGEEASQAKIDTIQAQFDREKADGRRDESGELVPEELRLRTQRNENYQLYLKFDEEKYLRLQESARADRAEEQARIDVERAQKEAKNAVADVVKVAQHRDVTTARLQKDRKKLKEERRSLKAKVKAFAKRDREIREGMDPDDTIPGSAPASAPLLTPTPTPTPSPTPSSIPMSIPKETIRMAPPKPDVWPTSSRSTSTSSAESAAAIKRQKQRGRFARDVLTVYAKAAKSIRGSSSTADTRTSHPFAHHSLVRDMGKRKSGNNQQDRYARWDAMEIDSVS